MPEDDQKDPQTGRDARPGVQANVAASSSMEPAASEASAVSTGPTGQPAPAAQSSAEPPVPRPAVMATSARPPVAPVTAVAPAPAAPPPFKAAPSMPLSMTQVPPGVAEPDQSGAGPDDEEFNRLIADFKPSIKRSPSLVARWWRGAGRHRRDLRGDEERHVAFDGYRSEGHDAKLERDRRYGTVYAVRESANAYLVRVELPRRLPATSLKQVWHLTAAPPAYEYTVHLNHNVVAIQARLRGEAVRRLAYVSPSFPSGFLTRIELREPVGRFKDRLRGQTIEVIVFKGAADNARQNGLTEPGAIAQIK